jgi:hypothetical protein
MQEDDDEQEEREQGKSARMAWHGTVLRWKEN